jgi:hypothetical protein
MKLVSDFQILFWTAGRISCRAAQLVVCNSVSYAGIKLKA